MQDAITNVLAPHEQQHITAFRTYNGTTHTPFDLTLCRGEFEARIQAMHDTAENARRAAAQAASDALDPFAFEVDLHCEDRPRSKDTRSTSAEPSPDGAGSDGEDTGEPNP